MIWAKRPMFNLGLDKCVFVCYTNNMNILAIGLALVIIVLGDK